MQPTCNLMLVISLLTNDGYIHRWLTNRKGNSMHFPNSDYLHVHALLNRFGIGKGLRRVRLVCVQCVYTLHTTGLLILLACVI